MKKHTCSPAFTLIELMVVVAIIAFLAALAVPRYFNYLAKAKQTEVMLNLSSLHAAQQIYWATHGSYNTKLAGSDSINWVPSGHQAQSNKKNYLYTYGFKSSDAQEGIHYFIGSLNTSQEHLKNTFANNTTFLAAAAGKIAGCR